VIWKVKSRFLAAKAARNDNSKSYAVIKLQNYPITKLQNSQSGFFHGKYKCTEQRRTQESQTGSAQEAQNGTSAEAAGVRARVPEAQSAEAGARTGEEVKISCQLAAVSLQV
jgi:hypothetical protein